MSIKELIKQLLKYHPYGGFSYDIPKLFRDKKYYKKSRYGLKNVTKYLLENNVTPVYMDVGAAGGLSREWGYYKKKGIVDIISFDLNDKWGQTHNLIKTALGNYDGMHEYYITRHPGCSSCRKPNHDIMSQYDISPYFEILDTKDIIISRFDTLVKSNVCQVPQFVKMDVQGFEHEVLEGFGNLLNDVLCVELESQFIEMYNGQVIFPELHNYMTQKQFSLRHIEPVIWPRVEGGIGMDYLHEINVFYTKVPRNENEKYIIKLWEYASGIWNDTKIETIQQQAERIDNISQ